MSEPSPAVPRTPLLLYDADCSFCSASARWLERRARSRLQQPGVPRNQILSPGAILEKRSPDM